MQEIVYMTTPRTKHAMIRLLPRTRVKHPSSDQGTPANLGGCIEPIRERLPARHTHVRYILHTTTHRYDILVPHGRTTWHDTTRHDQHSKCIVHYGTPPDRGVSIDHAAGIVWVIDHAGITGP